MFQSKLNQNIGLEIFYLLGTGFGLGQLNFVSLNFLKLNSILEHMLFSNLAPGEGHVDIRHMN